MLLSSAMSGEPSDIAAGSSEWAISGSCSTLVSKPCWIEADTDSVEASVSILGSRLVTAEVGVRPSSAFKASQ